jgi:hypothetical protein
MAIFLLFRQIVFILVGRFITAVLKSTEKITCIKSEEKKIKDFLGIITPYVTPKQGVRQNVQILGLFQENKFF